MPQMGYDMREGTLVKWNISVGTEISIGDVIAEIETDKAVVEFESPTKGKISKILVEAGQTVEVGKPIAIVEDGENDQVSDEPNNDTTTDSNIDVQEEIKAPDSILPDDHDQTNQSILALGIKASPIAKRLAGERGIDLQNVVGTGPGGRITKTDILNYSTESKPIIASEKQFRAEDLISKTIDESDT